MPTVDTNYNPFKQSGGGENYKRPVTQWDNLYKGVEGSSVGREIRFTPPSEEDLPWDITSTPNSSNHSINQLFVTEEETIALWFLRLSHRPATLEPADSMECCNTSCDRSDLR